MTKRAARSVLAGIGCATPPTQLNRTESVDVAASIAPADVPRDLLERIAEGTKIERRGCALVRPETMAALVDPQHAVHGPGTSERVEEWCRAGRPLAASSARTALHDAGVAPERVTHVVTASCTGFRAPGPDQWLIWDLGLRPMVRRTNLGFMGCHAAINALAVADAFVRADPQACVLVNALEISTAHMHYGNRLDRLIANALFADGSSSAVVMGTGPSGAPRIALTGATLMPDSTEEMGWAIGNNGFEMKLAPSVPGHLRREVGPWICSWLEQGGLTPAHIGGWAIHPGGPKIVEAIADTLQLPQEATEHSCGVLRDHGNMSSATVLFVIHRLRCAGVPLPWAAMSFGPGLAGEALLLAGAEA